ncbi:MAG: amine dehydrogenase large subunit [Pseudomonadota bacterium]
MMRKSFLLTAVLCLDFPAAAAELAVEPIPHVLSLPADYPPDWLFVHDGNFFGMQSGKIVLVDVAAQSRHYKAMIGASLFGNFAEAKTRPEIYVAETFYSRGWRGERTDVISIYDKASLAVTGEIVLPGGKRGQFLTEKGAFQLSADERFAFLFNFTPAASVTVIDLAARRILNDIDIPGCAQVFPTGRRSFSSLCGNGTLVTLRLDETGKVVEQVVSAAFNDLDEDPLFTRPAAIGRTLYFPSYKGRIQPIDFAGDVPVIADAWDLAHGEDAVQNWRPSGWQLASSDKAGRLYVLMRPQTREGEHDSGGPEVWVYDAAAATRVQRITLHMDGVSIEATASAKPLLAVVRADMALDVYDGQSGEWLRTIGGQLALTPFALFAVK